MGNWTSPVQGFYHVIVVRSSSLILKIYRAGAAYKIKTKDPLNAHLRPTKVRINSQHLILVSKTVPPYQSLPFKGV